MRLPKRGEKGFTLIELLIVVAILGVLAAVIIPNVGRFIGAGEEEAQKTELSNIQTAVVSMMTDNKISTLPVPISTEATRTNKMSEFPDKTSDNTADADGDGIKNKEFDPDANAYDFTTAGDLEGYLLYGHDINGGDGVPPTGGAAALVNYVATETTAYWYWVDADGTVHQSTIAPTP